MAAKTSRNLIHALEEKIHDVLTAHYQHCFTQGQTDFDHVAGMDGNNRRILCLNDTGRITLVVDHDLLADFFGESQEDAQPSPASSGANFSPIAVNDHQNPTTQSPEKNSAQRNTLISPGEYCDSLIAADDSIPVETAFAKRQTYLSKATFRSSLYTDIIATGQIEVESYHAGEGNRRQTLDNKGHGYHLGGISRDGFALGRRGMVAKQLNGVWLNSVVEYRPFASNVAQLNKAIWTRVFPEPEVLCNVTVGYNYVVTLTASPFNNVCVFSASGIVLYTATCGSGIPVTVASRDRIFGIVEQQAATQPFWNQIGTALPFKDLFTAKSKITKQPREFNLNFDDIYSTSPKTYLVTLYVVNHFPLHEKVPSFVHKVGKYPMTLFGTESLDWFGFTERFMGVAVINSGRCLGLTANTTTPGYLPQEIEQFGMEAQVESVAKLRNQGSEIAHGDIMNLVWNHISQSICLEWVTICPNLLDIFVKPMEKSRSRLYVVSASTSSVKFAVQSISPQIEVIPCRENTEMPKIEPLGEARQVGIKIPFRLPLSVSSEIENSALIPWKLHKWSQYYATNPTLSESKEASEKVNMPASLPWQFWDEIRLRTSRLEVLQDCWIANLIVARNGNIDDSELLASRLKDSRKNLDLATFKQVDKAMREGLLDAVVEGCQYFAFKTSLKQMVKQIEKTGDSQVAGLLKSIQEMKYVAQTIRYPTRDEISQNASPRNSESKCNEGSDRATDLKVGLKDSENVLQRDEDLSIAALLKASISSKQQHASFRPKRRKIS